MPQIPQQQPEAPPQATEAKPPPYAPQIELPEFEQAHLVRRVKSDYESAQSQHQKRKNKFARYQARWRPMEGLSGGSQGKSNFPVPVVKSQLLVKWAKMVEQMLGDDAEITAVPQGPSDQKVVHKIGRYMTWLLFSAMNIANELVEFGFNQLLYGRAHAYAPYEIVEVEDENGKSVVDYQGPGFHVLSPDDIILPSEEAKTIHDFSFVIHRDEKTLNELLDGEEAGVYQNISENFDKLYQAARTRQPTVIGQATNSTTEENKVKDVQQSAQGIEPGWGQSYAEKLEVWTWYGCWRMLEERDEEDGEGNASSPDSDGLEGRERRQTEIVVKVIPAIDLMAGCQKLNQMYPRKRNKRPFVEIALFKDGSYWCPSLPELIEAMEDDLTANHNLATEAVERSVGPVIFYRPGGGFDPDTFKYEPGLAVPMEDPTAVNVVRMQADISGAVEREQTTFRWVERTTGMTDLQSGRASDRPNAPRTLGQTTALLEESNIRVLLDMTVLRNDLADMLKHFFEIDTLYGNPATFFRVTEEDAKGLFETGEGGAYITQTERAGKFDFQLKFATSIYSREAEKNKGLSLYQLDLNNPLVVQNPHALWIATNRAHKLMGDDQFGEMVPEPPMDDMPMTAEQEWNAVLQGEDIHVHVQDNDDLHIKKHYIQVAMEMNLPAEERDAQAIVRMLAHIPQHEQQKLQKQQAAGVMQALLATMQGGGQQGQLSAGMPEEQEMQGPALPEQVPPFAGQNGSQSPGVI